MNYLTDIPRSIDASCAICQETYHEPSMLSCGHSFCRECLVSLDVLRCPLCKKMTTGSILDLSLNYALRDLCSSLVKPRTKKHNCSTCRFPKDLWSTVCRVSICQVAFEDGWHEDHSVLQVSESAKQLFLEIDEIRRNSTVVFVSTQKKLLEGLRVKTTFLKDRRRQEELLGEAIEKAFLQLQKEVDLQEKKVLVQCAFFEEAAAEGVELTKTCLSLINSEICTLKIEEFSHQVNRSNDLVSIFLETVRNSGLIIESNSSQPIIESNSSQPIIESNSSQPIIESNSSQPLLWSVVEKGGKLSSSFA